MSAKEKKTNSKSKVDKKRVIIDTDPGIDDTMALFLAFNSPEIHVEGITIVMGNHNDQNLLAKNACLVMHLARAGGACGMRDGHFIPVVKGAVEPIGGEYHGQSGIIVHGDNGIGGVASPIPSIDLSPLQHTHVSAAAFMVSHCLANPGAITIVTLGPLTNLALAVKMGGQPFVKAVKAVVMMGGTVGALGNKTPCAEANTANDPHAARIVFAAFSDITMAGLNATHQVSLPPIRDQLKPMPSNTIGRFCWDITEHYVDLLHKWRADSFVHDSTAVMAVIRPELFESQKVYVDVSTEGITAGVTVADWKGHWGKPAQTTVLMKVDTEGYVEEYIKRIQQYNPYTTTAVTATVGQKRKQAAKGRK